MWNVWGSSLKTTFPTSRKTHRIIASELTTSEHQSRIGRERSGLTSQLILVVPVSSSASSAVTASSTTVAATSSTPAPRSLFARACLVDGQFATAHIHATQGGDGCVRL